MSLATVECGARLFAKVHSEAHAIAPLLAQEFDISFKGSDDAVKLLNKASVAMSYDRSKHTLFAGKTIRVKVNWECLKFFNLTICDADFFSVMLTEEEFKGLIKQIGFAPKMFNVWKIAKKHRLMQEQ